MKKCLLILIATLAAQILVAHATVQFPTNTGGRRYAKPFVPVCTKQGLSIKAGEGDAAMGGVRETPFILTNTSSSACTLEGYPFIELLNRAGKVVKRATRQKSDEPMAPVTLEPGKTAWLMLNFNAGGAGYMGKPCPTYPKVRITAPGAGAAFVLRSEITSCRGTSVEVTSIRSGLPN